MNRSLLVVLGVIIIIAAYLVLSGKGSKPLPQTPNGPNIPSSTVIRVVDEPGKYSIEIPKDWVVTKEGPRGVRFSSLSVQSPDWQSVVDENTGGPSAIVNYKTGAVLYVTVTNENPPEPYHGAAEIIAQKNSTVDDVNAIYHNFREPSLGEGTLLDAHVRRMDRYYLFRFAYNPTTFPQGEQAFMNMLNSVRFEK